MYGSRHRQLQHFVYIWCRMLAASVVVPVLRRLRFLLRLTLNNRASFYQFCKEEMMWCIDSCVSTGNLVSPSPELSLFNWVVMAWLIYIKPAMAGLIWTVVILTDPAPLKTVLRHYLRPLNSNSLVSVC